MFVMEICAGSFYSFFFFNDTATTEIYTLSLHDALPIWLPLLPALIALFRAGMPNIPTFWYAFRSEEHTSELQSQSNLVCRLLLEKKKTTRATMPTSPYMSSRRNFMAVLPQTPSATARRA